MLKALVRRRRGGAGRWVARNNRGTMVSPPALATEQLIAPAAVPGRDRPGWRQPTAVPNLQGAAARRGSRRCTPTRPRHREQTRGRASRSVVLSMMRLPGSANTVNGTRMTRLVSPGLIALTGDGVRQWASTPVTSNRDGGMCRRGSRISGWTTAGSTPVSSAASRIAVAGGPVSPCSRAPPGNATSPAWSRRLGARCCSRTSGPPSRSVAIRIRTAACRSAAVSGTGSLRLSSSGRAAATAWTRPVSGAGTTAGRRSVGASQRARSSISEPSTFGSLTGFWSQRSHPRGRRTLLCRRRRSAAR